MTLLVEVVVFANEWQTEQQMLQVKTSTGPRKEQKATPTCIVCLFFRVSRVVCFVTRSSTSTHLPLCARCTTIVLVLVLVLVPSCVFVLCVCFDLV
jgi:hypothetical protein